MREDLAGWYQSFSFKDTFSIRVHVDFLGIWCLPSISASVFFSYSLIIPFILRDTVNSVGMFPNRLPLTGANNGVRVYRHAVSLDERRAKFKASLSSTTGGPKESPHIKQRRGDKPRREASLWEMENKLSDHPSPTDVLEVWFSGKRAGNSWNKAPTYIWFQDVTAVSRGSHTYQHISSPLTCRCRRRGGRKRNPQCSCSDSASVDDPTMLPCKHRDNVQWQVSRTNWPGP